jgi:hypothetical protein
MLVLALQFSKGIVTTGAHLAMRSAPSFAAGRVVHAFDARDRKTGALKTEEKIKLIVS